MSRPKEKRSFRIDSIIDSISGYSIEITLLRSIIHCCDNVVYRCCRFSNFKLNEKIVNILRFIVVHIAESESHCYTTLVLFKFLHKI